MTNIKVTNMKEVHTSGKSATVPLENNDLEFVKTEKYGLANQRNMV